MKPLIQKEGDYFKEMAYRCLIKYIVDMDQVTSILLTHGKHDVTPENTAAFGPVTEGRLFHTRFYVTQDYTDYIEHHTWIKTVLDHT